MEAINEEKQKPVADSWDGLVYEPRTYFKADDMKENEETLACVGYEIWSKDEDTRPQLQIRLQRKKGEDELTFSCNATNTKFIAENHDKPSLVVGKKITFTKVKATNPKTHKEVDSLRISKIE